MDLDLEGLYEEDGEEYDTPCQVFNYVINHQFLHLKCGIKNNVLWARNFDVPYLPSMNRSDIVFLEIIGCFSGTSTNKPK